MTTFDQILPAATMALEAHRELVVQLDWLVINRDLNGRVRCIVPEWIWTQRTQREQVEALYRTLTTNIVPHACPVESGILYEASRDDACSGGAMLPLKGFDRVWVVDRLATDGDWTRIAPETEGAPRMVFHSIEGGVGRSTAIAVCAWKLAQMGKRVLVVDGNLESPGLSSILLSADRQPLYGIADWLVEDLVDNADSVFEDMVIPGDLSGDGRIFVVPAHGKDVGEYLAKLGRIRMPKSLSDGTHEPWSARLQRLLRALENRIQPDVVLMDSPAGIGDIASSCVTNLGARRIWLFASNGRPTWDGYRILFDHWRRAGIAESIRERLQIVAALVPEADSQAYLQDVRERADDLFVETVYDDIPSSLLDFSPHTPLAARWHRDFASLPDLHGKLALADGETVRHAFGDLLGCL